MVKPTVIDLDRDNIIATVAKKTTFKGRRVLKGGEGSGHKGHAGRPGSVGGSVAGTGGGVAGGQFPSGPDDTYAAVNEMFLGGSWANPSDARRGRLKDEIAKTISRDSDATYDEVSQTMTSWAQSSNDHDMRSLSVQQAAAKEFGVPVSDFVNERVATVNAGRGTVQAAIHPDKFNPLMAEDRQRTVLRAMYNNTQRQLATEFGPDDTIRLRRGVVLEGKSGQPGWTRGGKVSVVGNPLESWSMSANVARDFANTSDVTGMPGTLVTPGYVLEMDVPVRNIVSTALTGSGALTEGEFIVLGSIPGQAKVIRVVD